jgi:HEPN domain-containing protein
MDKDDIEDQRLDSEAQGPPDDEEINAWLRHADRDLSSAQALADAGEWHNVLFHCQQAIEKTLKAIILSQTREAPPRIHSLPRLAEFTGIEFDQDVLLIIREIGLGYMETRYPDAGLQDMELSGEQARGYLTATREVRSWLLSKMR